MARTPDAFPGVRHDEGVVFDDDGVDPSEAGEVRHSSGSIRIQDSLGVFNTRPAYISSASNPTSTDDASGGFSNGMLWINFSTGSPFICLDNTVSASIWSAISAFAADEVGQHLISLDGSVFERAQPVVGPDDGWLANCDGELLVEGLIP